MSLDIDALRKLAAKADAIDAKSPDRELTIYYDYPGCAKDQEVRVATAYSLAWAKWIAATTPAKVLAILDTLTRAEAARDEAERRYNAEFSANSKTEEMLKCSRDWAMAELEKMKELHDALTAKLAEALKERDDALARPDAAADHYRRMEAQTYQRELAALAERDALRAALVDMRGGWRYIREVHGDLPGVGWDRCEKSATDALAAHGGAKVDPS